MGHDEAGREYDRLMSLAREETRMAYLLHPGISRNLCLRRAAAYALASIGFSSIVEQGR